MEAKWELSGEVLREAEGDGEEEEVLLVSYPPSKIRGVFKVLISPRPICLACDDG